VNSTTFNSWIVGKKKVFSIFAKRTDRQQLKTTTYAALGIAIRLQQHKRQNTTVQIQYE